jgi:hypothetical protein
MKMLDYDTAADGDLLNRVVELREQLAEVREQEKALKGEMDMIEAQLMRRMDERKTDRLSNDKLTASKQTSVEAKVVDWDAVFEFIKTSGDFSLLQKRIAVTAFRELLTMGQVPGIIPNEVTKVGFRKR